MVKNARGSIIVRVKGAFIDPDQALLGVTYENHDNATAHIAVKPEQVTLLIDALTKSCRQFYAETQTKIPDQEPSTFSVCQTKAGSAFGEDKIGVEFQEESGQSLRVAMPTDLAEKMAHAVLGAIEGQSSVRKPPRQ